MSAPRVLLVKFSAIGDCVMALSAATAIRQEHPEAYLAWAIYPRCAPVVDTDRLVDLLFEVPRDRWKQGGPGSSIPSQIRHFLQLRQYRFDVGIDLQGHSKTAVCLRLAAPKRRVSIRATDVFSRLIAPPIPAPPHDRHEMERNSDALRAAGFLGGTPTPILPDLGTAPDEVPGLQGERPLATIAVGAGLPKKLYPLEAWASVARGLLARGYRVGFLGGPGETAPAVEGATDWVGRLSLRQTMAAVSASAVHLAADTGTGHMAAAYGVPVVTVFGPTSSARYRPYTQRGIVLEGGASAANVPPDRALEAALTLAEGV